MKGKMPMKRNAITRILCTLLCAAMLLGASAVALPVSAAPAASTSAAAPEPSFFAKAVDFVFRNFGFLGFIFDPYQFTVINQKPVFQFGLGFNNIYDIFPWMVNVWADTVICEFNYGGKDWRIQFWKGGYGVFFATGGEIGVYTKPVNMPVNHYNAPLTQDDWLYMTYTIYNKGEKLFTRPSPYLVGDVGPYWWAPGYKILSICTDFFNSPRSNVVMDATLELKDSRMAAAFIEQLKAKGFSELKTGKLGLGTPEKFQVIGGKSVRFIWKNINEGWY